MKATIYLKMIKMVNFMLYIFYQKKKAVSATELTVLLVRLYIHIFVKYRLIYKQVSKHVKE